VGYLLHRNARNKHWQSAQSNVSFTTTYQLEFETTTFRMVICDFRIETATRSQPPYTWSRGNS